MGELVTPKIAVIAGSSRSGSTHLGRKLAEANGAAYLGEVCYIVERGLQRNWLCQCGMSFANCDFWVEVLRRDDLGRRLSSDSAQGFLRLVTNSKLTRLRRQAKGSAWQEFLHVLGDLYRSIYISSGHRLLIDTSKAYTYVWILRQVPNIELNIVHLVRDPVAVAYSQASGKRYGDGSLTDVRRPSHTALAWAKHNSALVLIGRPAVPIRYERMGIIEPTWVMEALGVTFAGGRAISHGFSGNPDHSRELQKFIPDLRWAEDTSLMFRFIVRLITGPTMKALQLRYHRSEGWF